MKSKLKKKVLASQTIIFPQTFGKESAQKPMKVQKMEGSRADRSLTRFQAASIHQRSISLKESNSLQKAKRLKQPAIQASSVFVKTKSKSLLKRSQRGNSSIELSKIYHAGMQQLLKRQCEAIMNEAEVHRSTSTYNMETVASNLLFIKKQPGPPIAKKLSKASMPVIPSITQIITSQQSSSFPSKISNQQALDISLSNESNSEATLKDSMKMNNSMILERSHHRSSAAEEFNINLADFLKKIEVWFLSWKFSVNFVTYFKVKIMKLEYSSKTCELDLLFQFYGQYIFKRVVLVSSNDRRLDHRLRKGNLRKLQATKEKMKDKVLSTLFRSGQVTTLAVNFYQELLQYLEHYINLEKTQRGLAFIDFQEGNLQVKNQERLYEFLKTTKSFYFLLKIGTSFYFVKAIPNQDQLKIIILCDFTNLSCGDQLAFQRPLSKKIKQAQTERQSQLLFIHTVGQFLEESRRSQRLSEQDSIHAKVSKASMQSIQKGQAITGRWNGNQSFCMMGDLTNFFTIHNCFDYGYFSSPQPYLKSDIYFYSLSQYPLLPVYSYPHSYHHLLLTQAQQQTFLIPHLPYIKQDQAEMCKTRFIKSRLLMKQKQLRQEWIMYINRQIVRINATQAEVKVTIKAKSSLRTDCITFPINVFQPPYDFISFSNQIPGLLKKYQLQNGFLYKRLNLGPSHLQIYYKGLQKFEGQYVFVTLYHLPFHGITEFKIYMFRLGREFVIKLDCPQPPRKHCRQIIGNLLVTVKNTYFKKLLQQQARRSKKRRLDALQDFLKQHGKSYVNHPRKKKQEQQRRNKRIASMKNGVAGQVYEEIMSKRHKLRCGKQIYITIRYLPSDELKDRRQWKSQQIEIALHCQGYIAHFITVLPIHQLVSNVSKGKLSLEHLDHRQIHAFFSEIYKKLITIMDSHAKIGLSYQHLRNFLIGQADYYTNFVQLKLVGNNLIENVELDRQDGQSNISIQLSLQQTHFSLGPIRSLFPLVASEFTRPPTNIKFDLKQPSQQWERCSIGANNILAVVQKSDGLKRNGKVRLGESTKIKQIWVIQRQSGGKGIVGQWEAQFVGEVMLREMNSRMFKRLNKSLASIL